MESEARESIVTTACPSCGHFIDITDLEPGDGITCPYCSHEFPITRQFGNFLLECQVGAGGMGAVYRGRDITLNRAVAVKVLLPKLASDKKFIATFLHEVEITGSLNHPNVVQVYAFGENEGTYYMVVEYLSGGTLDDRLQENGRISELEAIEIGIAVARGLECALQQGGLIHRDIKPGNILFNSSNTPKVVDFGLSLSVDSVDHFDGQIWGTPYYVAPEKLELKPETFSSDLYSLGATLFHAIAGRPPYDGKDPNEVALKHLSGRALSLKSFVPDISDQTAYAISKAMARYPEDRHESHAAFIQQLEDAKRRITDPHIRQNRKEDMVIIESSAVAKYSRRLMIGMVAVTVLLGLIIWKAPVRRTSTAPIRDDEFSNYTPGLRPDEEVIGTTSESVNRIDTVVLSTDNRLWWKNWTGGSTWNDWSSLRIPAASGPASANWGDSRFDIFYQGPDGGLKHRANLSGIWATEENLEMSIIGGPAATAWSRNRLDVVVRGADNKLWWRNWNGSNWNPWSEIDASTLTSSPALTNWGPGRLDAFYVGSDHSLKHRSNTNGSWNEEENLGGTFASGPTAVAWAPGRFDVFVRGADNGLWWRSWNGSDWGGWSSLGGILVSDPAASSRGSGLLDVFYKGSDGNLKYREYDNGTWAAEQDLGKPIKSP